LAAEEGTGEEQAAALAGGSQWFQLYHVEPGDTLSGIALWWFGSSAETFWRRIWLANRRTIGPNPNLIRSSQWLRLPFSGFNYHVERGDTLSQLAQWVYGDGNQWERIHDANPWIQDPNHIEASWWIWIPG
jgi:peptidoglycan-N-acetylglucosamine deacetylase